MELVLLNNQEQVKYDQNLAETLKNAAEIVLKKHGLTTQSELTLLFVDDEEIKDLNKNYRGLELKTDVLSFPQFDSLSELEETIAQGLAPVLLGDIVISLETALQQGEEYGHGLAREVGFLFVHGLLHLLGYDHLSEDEQEKMRQMEEAVLGELSLTR